MKKILNIVGIGAKIKPHFFSCQTYATKKIEEICIFGGSTYFPQITDGHVPTNSAVGCTNGNAYHGKKTRNYKGGNTTRYPNNLLEFVVLDNCAGSGTTGVACKNLNRNCVLIKKEKSYYDICVERLK